MAFIISTNIRWVTKAKFCGDKKKKSEHKAQAINQSIIQSYFPCIPTVEPQREPLIFLLCACIIC